MGHLTELTIRSFRHAAPCTLRFSPEMNVVVGKNGTGKSNLLALLRCVLACDFRALKGEAFDVSWVWAHDGLTLRVSFSSTGEAPSDPHAPIAWHLSVELSGDGGRWADVVCDERSVDARVLDDERGLVVARHAVTQDPWGVDLVASSWIWATVALKTVTGAVVRNFERVVDELALVRSVHVVDEGLETFGRWVETTPSEYGLHWHQVTGSAGAWLPAGVPLDMVPASRLRPDPEGLRYHRGDLAWVDEFCRLAELRDLRLRVSVSEGSAQVMRFNDWDLLAHLDAENLVRGSELSYGQKRLLVALFVREAAPGAFLADELSNGLHHTWVEWLVRSVADRQSFLTAQDALVIDMLPAEDPATLRRSMVVCTRVSGGWSWSQLDEAASESLGAALRTGFQQTSEALLTRGIW